MTRWPISPLLIVVVAACTSDATGPEGALEQALARARPMASDASPDDIAVARSATRLEARLSLAFTTASTRESLLIERNVERAVDQFRIRDSRAHTSPSAADPKVDVTARERVESVFDGRAFAWRRGDGQWIERDVLDGLPTRTLTAATGLADYVVRAFADYFEVKAMPGDADHPTTLGGGKVQWSRITLDPAVRPLALSADELQALRANSATTIRWIAATHRPTRVSGELARDTAGHVVAATLSIEGATTLPDGPATFAITLTQGFKDLPSDTSFLLPVDRLPESRERPWLMIEDVVGDALLPPYARPKPSLAPSAEPVPRAHDQSVLPTDKPK